MFIALWPHNVSCMSLSSLVFCCIVFFICMCTLLQSWGTCLCSDIFPPPLECFVYAALPACTSLSMQSDPPVDLGFDGIVVFSAFSSLCSHFCLHFCTWKPQRINRRCVSSTHWVGLLACVCMCVFGCNDNQPCFSFHFRSILHVIQSVVYERANSQRQQWPVYKKRWKKHRSRICVHMCVYQWIMSN